MNAMHNRDRSSRLFEDRLPENSVPFSVPAGIAYVGITRKLIDEGALTDLAGRLRLYLWWEVHGVREFPDAFWCLNPQDLESIQTLDPCMYLEDRFTGCSEGFRNCLSLLSRDSRYLKLLVDSFMGSVLPAPLPLPMALILRDRVDVAGRFDVTTLFGYVRFVDWWILSGHQEYPGFFWNPMLLRDRLPEDGVPFSVPVGIACVGITRKLIDEGALTDLAGRLRLYLWWEVHGIREFPDAFWCLNPQDLESIRTLDPSMYLEDRFIGCSEGFRNCLSLLSRDSRFSKLSVDSFMGSELPAPLPFPLALILRDRIDVAGTFDVSTLFGYVRFVDWWILSGHLEYPGFFWNPLLSGIRLPEDAIASLNEYVCVPGSSQPIKKILYLIYKERSDLVAAFKSDPRGMNDALIHWWDEVKEIEYPFSSTLCVEDFTFRANSCVEGGLNLIGFPFGILGLGEDLRMGVHALDSAGVPVCILDAPIRGPEKADFLLRQRIRLIPQFRTSLFYLPPTDMMRVPMEGGGGLLDYGEYNIAAMPWELPLWPEKFGALYTLIDEIWAQSDYVAHTFQQSFSGPVINMPMVVETPSGVASDRDYFGIPYDKTVFLIMFDGSSWLTRKNPLAAAHAFQVAFGVNDDVHLVVKAMNVNTRDQLWIKFVNIASRDARIKIIHQTFNRIEASSLIASCDVYVSLHRSEGFGRVIAEAMLLDVATITSNFSGNLDFCTADTSYLVDGDVVPLNKGEYLLAEGQYWFEPSIDDAARQMVLAYENSSKRADVVIAARSLIESNYSREAVASAYRERLKTLAVIS